MVDGIELDLCDGCGGTWYDRGELEQHVAAGDPAPDDGPGQQPNREFHREADKLDTRYLKCPICASMMTRKNWSRLSGIIIDICGPHGLFIDAGEFERIRDFEGSGTKARADRLVSWEQARDQKERSRKEAQVRQDLHREIRKSRGFWRQF